MASDGLAGTPLSTPGNAKAYNRTKLITGIASSAAAFAFLVVLVISGFSSAVSRWTSSLAPDPYVALIFFTACVGVMTSALTLPIEFYSGYVVEHRYRLSHQSLARWAWERLKALLVSLPIALGVLLLLYYCLNAFGLLWWLPVAIAVSLLSVILARLAPVLIMPLFYRFTPLPEGSLKERILKLSSDAGVRVSGVFSFNLSKNTRKANAAFTGIGAAKRIILGDTLVNEFTEEEIETVFAHELGHVRGHHIAVGIILGLVSTFAGLWIAAQAYDRSVAALGFASITDIAALPVLAIWLSLFGLLTSPLANMLSRRHERQADAYAARTTGNGPAFASALRKLASMNLADPDPHPVVEFLFYSHPSISRRIAAVESGATR